MNHALILAEKLAREHDLSDVELLELLESRDSKTALFLQQQARCVSVFMATGCLSVG